MQVKPEVLVVSLMNIFSSTSERRHKQQIEAHIGEAISPKFVLCSSMSTVLESSGELHTEKLPWEGKGHMAQPLFIFPSVSFTIFVALKVPLMKSTSVDLENCLQNVQRA